MYDLNISDAIDLETINNIIKYNQLLYCRIPLFMLVFSKMYQLLSDHLNRYKYFFNPIGVHNKPIINLTFFLALTAFSDIVAIMNSDCSRKLKN